MNQFIAVLKALSDETRLRLLRLLLTRDLCGKALARSLGISEAAVSQHLRTLREAGLVAGEKRGYWVHYAVEKRVIEDLISELENMTSLSPMGTADCQVLQLQQKGPIRKEVKTMCQGCCQKPEKLKGKPEECTPQQIKDCHGDAENHPCAGDKKEGKWMNPETRTHLGEEHEG